eukprot:COSAG02_NODE_399_length_23112_cov_1107.712349_11_plen_79_part_00
MSLAHALACFQPCIVFDFFRPIELICIVLTKMSSSVTSLRKLRRGEALPESEGWGGQVAYQSLDQPLDDLKDPFGDEL